MRSLLACAVAVAVTCSRGQADGQQLQTVALGPNLAGVDVAGGPQASAPLSGAAAVAAVLGAPRPLTDLTPHETLLLLRAWNLEHAFGAAFRKHRYDGMILGGLLSLVFPGALSLVADRFPQADVLEWVKLQTLVRRVMESGDGAVDLGALLSVQEQRQQQDQQHRDQQQQDQEQHQDHHRQQQDQQQQQNQQDQQDRPPQQRRRLESLDGYSGVLVSKAMAMVGLGVDTDVALRRTGTGGLAVDADTILFDALAVNFSAAESFVVNGTDLLECCNNRSSMLTDLQHDVELLFEDVVGLAEELYYVHQKLNYTCSQAERGESSYDCDWLTPDWGGAAACVENIVANEEAWTDRSYQFADAPDNLLGTYHTYMQVEMDGSPPCTTEGGFSGTLAKDAIVGICCANHGTYSAAGNQPYASKGNEGYSSYALGLDWTEHGDSWALNNHPGNPCTFFETFVEAGDYLFCCSEAWATGIFVTQPPFSCD